MAPVVWLPRAVPSKLAADCWRCRQLADGGGGDIERAKFFLYQVLRIFYRKC
jgi:hypothetical protein